MIALIPYAFIGLYCDAAMTKFTLLGYGVTLFCMIFLLATSCGIKQKISYLFLSIISFVESYVLAKYFFRKRVELLFQTFYCIKSCHRNHGILLIDSTFEINSEKRKE